MFCSKVRLHLRRKSYSPIAHFSERYGLFYKYTLTITNFMLRPSRKLFIPVKSFGPDPIKGLQFLSCQPLLPLTLNGSCPAVSQVRQETDEEQIEMIEPQFENSLPLLILLKKNKSYIKPIYFFPYWTLSINVSKYIKATEWSIQSNRGPTKATVLKFVFIPILPKLLIFILK